MTQLYHLVDTLVLCSKSLLVKYDFILRLPYEAWVNDIRASSFIENFPQISAKPVAYQQNLPFFTDRFTAKLASKIPAKFLPNQPFFLRICPWKSRKIWLFSATYHKLWLLLRTNKPMRIDFLSIFLEDFRGPRKTAFCLKITARKMQLIMACCGPNLQTSRVLFSFLKLTNYFFGT